MIFFDVDTQIDFLLPVGALYVPGAEKMIPALARLTDFARTHNIPIFSGTDAHAPQDPEFRDWPPHCVAGTLGQRKVPETLLANPLTIPNVPGPLPEGWQRAQQVIVEKQTLDPFETHTLARLLEGRLAGRFVVYGVVTEYCVLCAARGLLGRGARIEIVTDAIREIDPARGRQVLAELEQAGARLTTVAEVTNDSMSQ
jgi:nicotinamidase/pyrazinamidase